MIAETDIRLIGFYEPRSIKRETKNKRNSVNKTKIGKCLALGRRRILIYKGIKKKDVTKYWFGMSGFIPISLIGSCSSTARARARY